ncbi:MAG TPA: S8 family serine peptidase, partial [candidate division Zixibacteria bacterium]|nr:S8 family serine peptidase [candidate division Zixibacteria bacterium]
MGRICRVLGAPLAALALFCGALSLTVSAESDTPVIPNDPYFGEQLGFYNPPGADSLRLSSRSNRRELIPVGDSLDHRIAEAWAITTGSADVIIAVLDDGFPYTDPDIRENIWRNPGESGLDAAGIARESNGKDDDGNGYIDDVIGWDFVFDDPDPDGYAFDGKDVTRIAPYHHSAPALGIIGARGNNGIGVAGINWRVSLQLLKIGAQGETNGGRAGRAARAIRYAVDNGARAINWSGFVSDTNSLGLDSLREAVAYADSAGVL